MAFEPLDTLEGQDYPLCRQLSVFLENRLGQLLRLTRLFQQEPVHILGISVDPSADCAIARLIVDHPDEAAEMIRGAGFACTESELLVVELPPGKRGIMNVCIALLTGEINMGYLYPLFPGNNRGACLAIQVDDMPRAAEVLAAKNFHVLDQSELS